MNTEEIFAKGLAICGADILDQKRPYWCRFRGESFKISGLLSNDKPARFVRFREIPELRYGFVAAIDEVRESARFA